MTIEIKDLADRYTILMLKLHHGVKVQEELDAYLKELPDIDEDLLDDLYTANAMVWELEKDIGEIALEIRSWNNKRNDIKNKIAEKYGGRKDIKTNYVTNHSYLKS